MGLNLVKICVKSFNTSFILLSCKMLQYLIKFPLECRNLFLIGESDVQSRGNGIDELNPMLLSSTN